MKPPGPNARHVLLACVLKLQYCIQVAGVSGVKEQWREEDEPQALQGHGLPSVQGGALVRAASMPVGQFLSVLVLWKASTARCMPQGGWEDHSREELLRSKLAFLAPDSCSRWLGCLRRSWSLP